MKRQAYILFISMLVSDFGLSQTKDNELVIEINQGLPSLETTVRETTAGMKVAPVSDGGELLQSITGVSAIRMGGRALDPVIRGQRETQLNVLLDGGYIHGGCPNRMDPPSSYTSVDSYDRVTLIKGNRTVAYGGGGSGGTILFERDWPEIDDKGYNIELSGDYGTNGDRWALGVDAVLGNQTGYFRVIGHKSEAEDYKDGLGHKIESQYNSQANALLGGVQLGDSTRLQFSYEKTDEENVLFAGAGMNSPYADAENIRIKLEHQFSSSSLKQLKFDLYRSDVKHLMDNARVFAPSTSETYGIRLMLDAEFADVNWLFGVDMQNNERVGTGYRVANSRPMFSLWPDVEIKQHGIFIEGETTLGQNDLLKTGVRYDRVTANATKVNQHFGMRTPAEIYHNFYGVSDTDSTENNFAGFVTWTHRLNQQYSLEASLSRSIRTADATERYIAKRVMRGSWIGNPQIKPEKHQQLELVLASHKPATDWSVTAWYNQVDDYILRYKSGSNSLYKNVDAALYGLEAEFDYAINDNFKTGLALSWLRGRNKSEHTNLSRIAPLELSTTIDYTKQQWKAGLEWKLVAAQNRVCLSSNDCAGLDVRKTPGYGLVNLYAGYEFKDDYVVSIGIDNLFDKYYSLHESRDYVLDPAPVQVTEPGRNLWIRLNVKF